MDEDHYHINDLYEDMDRLNALYEELMWPHDVELEFSADYENNRIIISMRNDELKRPTLWKMINNDCKLLINLNQLVRDRPNGQDLDTEHVDQIANDLRRNMNFDSFYEQADVAITDYCDDVGINLKENTSQSFGFVIHQGGKE